MECEAACNLADIFIAVYFSTDPGKPSIFLVAKYSTSLNLTWNVSDAPYTVEWQKTGCLAKDGESNGSITTNNQSVGRRSM